MLYTIKRIADILLVTKRYIFTKPTHPYKLENVDMLCIL